MSLPLHCPSLLWKRALCTICWLPQSQKLHAGRMVTMYLSISELSTETAHTLNGCVCVSASMPICVYVCVCVCVCLCVLMSISCRPEMGRGEKSGSKGGRLRFYSLAVNRGSRKSLGEKVSMAAPKWTKGALLAVRGSGRRLGNWSPPSQTPDSDPSLGGVTVTWLTFLESPPHLRSQLLCSCSHSGQKSKRHPNPLSLTPP